MIDIGCPNDRFDLLEVRREAHQILDGANSDRERHILAHGFIAAGIGALRRDSLIEEAEIEQITSTLLVVLARVKARMH